MEKKLNFLSKLRIRSEEIFDDSIEYLNRLYNTKSKNFKEASPFNQILRVVSEITNLLFFYIEDVAVENNIVTARNKESIYGISRLTGHDPHRGTSSRGIVRFRLNPAFVFNIQGNFVLIPNRTRLELKNSGVKYIIKFSGGDLNLARDVFDWYEAEIVQGVLEKTNFTAEGVSLESFNIPLNTTIDHSEIKVYVNGEEWEIFENLYDIDTDEKGVLVKTGFNNGLDIFFGNGKFGKIPESGSLIEVEYLRNNGKFGDFADGRDLVYAWEDSGIDDLGGEYNLNELLITESVKSPTFGANSEEIAFTKLIAPKYSKVNVFARTEDYEYYIAKTFRPHYINAYTNNSDEFLDDDHIIYVFMLPDIDNKISGSLDYFNLPESEFLYNEAEIGKIKQLIADTGRQLITSELRFKQGELTRYSLDINIRYFDDVDKLFIYSEARKLLSEYFIKLNRRDRIPKSDLIALIETINGVDSVSITFYSQRLEKILTDGEYIRQIKTVKPITPFLEESDVDVNKKRLVFFEETITEETVPVDDINNIPKEISGLDEFGDIYINQLELPIIRGGFTLSNGTRLSNNISFKDSVLREGDDTSPKSAVNFRFEKPIPRNFFL